MARAVTLRLVLPRYVTGHLYELRATRVHAQYTAGVALEREEASAAVVVGEADRPIHTLNLRPHRRLVH